MTKYTNYESNNRSKYFLKCHLIFACKYRRSLLLGRLKNDMNDIFKEIAQSSDFEIEIIESDKDHIHMLLRYTPVFSISQIVRRLKQQSTARIWKKYGKTLKKYYWYKKIFWSDGYFVCSIGEASPETIRNYILSQG